MTDTISTGEPMFLCPTIWDMELMVTTEKQPITREHTLPNTLQCLHKWSTNLSWHKKNYADDLCSAAQAKDLAQIEATLTLVLSGPSVCYTKTQLCNNPVKSQMSLFCL